jgi:DHA3 family macrolide efflux protein-like MFS transporter
MAFWREMRTFLIIWAGQLVSMVGSGLTSFAFGVWVYLQTGSTSLFALNILAYTLPTILFSAVIGSVVDRIDRKLVMIFSDVGSGLTTVAIWLLFTSGHLQAWHVLLVSFLNATFNSFQWTAQSAVVSLIVPKIHLGRASGMSSVADAITMVAAPAIAGVLYTAIGLGGIILVDVFTFCFAIFTLVFVRIPAPPPEGEAEHEKQSFWQDGVLGWNYVWQRPGLMGLLVYFAGLYFLVGMVDPLLNTMLIDLGGPQALGGVLSVMGAGYLIGTLVMSAWGGPKRRGLGILIVGIIQGVVMVGFGISASLVVVSVSVFVFSLLDPIVGGSSQALWQTKVKPVLQGRVFAVRRMVSRTGQALALLAAGPLAEKVFEPLLLANGPLEKNVGQILGVGPGRGVGFLFVLLGVLFVIFSLIGLSYHPLRRVDEGIPDAL